MSRLAAFVICVERCSTMRCKCNSPIFSTETTCLSRSVLNIGLLHFSPSDKTCFLAFYTSILFACKTYIPPTFSERMFLFTCSYEYTHAIRKEYALVYFADRTRISCRIFCVSRALIMGLLTYVSVHHARFRTQYIFGNVSESVHCILACFYSCTHDQIYNKIMNTIDKRKR